MVPHLWYHYLWVYCIVSEKDENVLPTKHCRYIVPTEIKLRPTFDNENKNEEFHWQWETCDRDSKQLAHGPGEKNN
jgi:hypothetical protein